MDKEEIKNKIDFKKIIEVQWEDGIKGDYLQDSEGNNIIALNPLDVILIEKIQELEKRIKELESK